MVQDLTFTKNAINRWESSFVSSGSKTVVQLKVNKDSKQQTSNEVLVYGNLSGMDKSTLANLGRSSTGVYLFEVDVPADVVVTVECLDEPLSGKISTEL